MTREEIENMTITMGEGWGYAHVRRVLALAQQIAGDLQYHPDWFWYAAQMHDWGAFPRWRETGVDHALRSRQVAESEVLPALNLSDDANSAILEAIEYHDYRDPRPVRSPEALLLREADFLDFLGPLGMARDFAWGPNDLTKGIARIHSRIAGIRGRFRLPAAQALGEARIQRMEELLKELERDSFGYF